MYSICHETSAYRNYFLYEVNTNLNLDQEISNVLEPKIHKIPNMDGPKDEKKRQILPPTSMGYSAPPYIHVKYKFFSIKNLISLLNSKYSFMVQFVMYVIGKNTRESNTHNHESIAKNKQHTI